MNRAKAFLAGSGITVTHNDKERVLRGEHSWFCVLPKHSKVFLDFK